MTGFTQVKGRCCPNRPRNTSTFNRFKPSTLSFLFLIFVNPNEKFSWGILQKLISTCNICVNRLGSRVDFSLCKFSVYPPMFVTDHHLCHKDWSEVSLLFYSVVFFFLVYFIHPPISVTDHHLCNRDCCEVSLSIQFYFSIHPPIFVTDHHLCHKDCCEVSIISFLSTHLSLWQTTISVTEIAVRLSIALASYSFFQVQYFYFSVKRSNHTTHPSCVSSIHLSSPFRDFKLDMKSRRSGGLGN